MANGIKEGIYTRKNTSTAWSPAGTNGAASGTYNELILAFVMRFNGNGQVADFDTFNLGFGKHFYGWGTQVFGGSIQVIMSIISISIPVLLLIS